MQTTQEFFERVERVRKRLGISRFPAWFRGHSDQSYRLLPGILRRSNGLRHERNLYANFKTQASGLTDTKVASWELLALMQHHGVPTRLVDWTHSLHTALFFALLGRITSPVLWVLNPYELNRQATGKRVIFDQADELGTDYYEAICNKDWPYELPVAFEAPWKSARVISQRGCFTFHGTSSLSLEETCKSCVKAVPIPPHLVSKLRAHLRDSGVDHFRLFPDLDGLARNLKAQFKFENLPSSRPRLAPDGSNADADRTPSPAADVESSHLPVEPEALSRPGH